MKRCPLGVVLITLHLVFLLTSASAHSVILWAYYENGNVYVEAFTQDGTKIKNAKLIVVDKSDKRLLEGTTDTEGKFTFVPPVKDEMTIVMIIDDAHQAEFKLMAEDFQQ